MISLRLVGGKLLACEILDGESLLKGGDVFGCEIKVSACDHAATLLSGDPHVGLFGRVGLKVGVIFGLELLTVLAGENIDVCELSLARVIQVLLELG